LEFRRTDWSTIPYGEHSRITNKPIYRDDMIAETQAYMLQQTNPTNTHYYASRRECLRVCGTLSTPGGGKTLFLAEVARSVPQPFRERAVTLFFSFNSATSINSLEDKEIQRNQFTPMFLHRLLWSYFSGDFGSWHVFIDLHF
jgi:hypothetical protein